MMNVQYFLGHSQEQTLEEVLAYSSELPAWRPFDQRAVNFVARFSQRLLMHPDVRRYPEIAALGHWFRAARMRDLAQNYPIETDDAVIVGRGLAFHLAPANVDSVFMYSWLISLLAGNANIVRVSQKISPQLAFLVDVLNNTLQEDVGQAVQGRIVIMTYPHDEEITRAISLQCMLRVVWGGDATVATIRAVPLRSTATEICFPDRFSAAAIKAESIATADEDALKILASNFYNDAFWFGQQACSSPRLVNWVGDSALCAVAQARFWRAVRQEVKRRAPEDTPAMGMARLAAAFEYAASSLAHPSVQEPFVQSPARLELEIPVSSEVKALHCGNSLFLEQRLDGLEQLACQLSDKEQTLAVHGFSRAEIMLLVSALSPRSLDRIVPMGEALGFAPVWDGTDLFIAFSRRISIPKIINL
jgi:hypothetical protein